VGVRRREDTRVSKPWGYEDRWAITDRYLGKIILVIRGEMDFDLDDEGGRLLTHRLREGDSVRVTPGRRHRMTAVTDVDVFEVSTPEIDDVVRLEDRYGRAGR